MVQGPGRWLKAAYSSAAIHGGTGALAVALDSEEPTASGGGKVGGVDGATPGVFALREQLRHIVNLQFLHCQASDPFFKEWPPFQQVEMWVRA